MTYLPPHLRGNNNRVGRRNRSRKFINSLNVVKAPEFMCSKAFPELCSVRADIAQWDPKEMIRGSRSEEKGWWGREQGYLYLTTASKSALDTSKPRKPDTGASKMCSANLVDLLERHTDSFYDKFPNEKSYDVGPDYESSDDENEDEEENSSEDEYGVY